MQYAIHESNIERLEKKLTRISNKCQKYGLEFRYEKVGEEFRPIKDADGNEIMTKYIIVEAEGKAEQSGWEFVATLEHSEEGNLIKGYGTHEVPERYYHCEAKCEHCNSNRTRRNSYIVYNAENDEYKQVGKNCLADFTNGLDAEKITAYISCFDELIKGEAPSEGCNYARYFELEEMLCYFTETIKHFGYVKTQEFEKSTATRALDYYRVEKGNIAFWTRQMIEECKKEMETVGFKADTEENHIYVKAMLGWIEKQKDNSNYFHNLKVLCKQNYIESSNFGLVASMPATYNKDLIREAEKRQRELEAMRNKESSDYVGNVGDRIEFDIRSQRVLWSRDTQFGMTFGFELIDTDGNVYVWSTSNYIDEDAKHIKATVKEHKEFRDVKQTIITRCRVS